MVAKMHKAAENFQPETILQYDSTLCERIKRKLESEEATGILGKTNQQVILAACNVMQNRLCSNQNIITVHTDLQRDINHWAEKLIFRCLMLMEM